MQLTLWAQTGGPEAPSPSGAASGATVQSINKSAPSSVQVNQPKSVSPAEEPRGELSLGEDPDNRLIVPFAKHLAGDQRDFWTAPAHFRVQDLKWIAPFAGVTAGFMAGDSWISKQIPLSKVQTSKTVSDYGAYSLIAAGGGAFLLGHITGNDHMSEAGLLSGEAAINSTAIAMLLKSATQRPRPYEANGSGTFFQGGSSFPSEHAAIAWSVASVMAHEYPGTLTQILAYGLATTISATRVTGQQHFASDVIIGSALGWYFGRQVYRSHHDTELGGTVWGKLLPESSGDRERNPENMGSPYVPLDSWVYPALERLIALGYIKTGYLGIRPWTRMECARMLEEVEQNIADQDDPSSVATHIYRDLDREFTPETTRLNGAANLGASVDSVYARATNIFGPPLRDGYHFGQTIIDDYGRPYGDGMSFIGGASAHAVVGPLAFYILGEYQQAPGVTPFSSGQLQSILNADFATGAPSPPSFTLNAGPFSRFEPIEATISLNVKNLQFSFGKQTAWLGPADGASFLYSNNTRSIVMLKIDTTAPFEVPLLSKLLGPMRTEFFLGRLAGQQWIYSPPTLYGPYPSNQPFIHANKLSFKPTQNLELGAGFTAVFAGAGVPFTFSEFLRTFYSHTAQLANNPGKRFSQVDLSYRVPGARNWLTVYLDSLVVDEYSPVGSTRASVHPGIYIPQFPRIPKLQLRAEAVHETRTREFQPGFVYTDGRYLGGYTNEGFPIGDWIGRAGLGGQAWLTYSFSAHNSLQLGYRGQRVSKLFLEGGALNDWSAKWTQSIKNHLEISAFMQYENWQFPLLATGQQRNFTSSIQLTYRPRWSLGAK